MNEYFIFPVFHIESYTKNTLFDELTRNDELANDDREEVSEENSEYIDVKFSTWHRENKNGKGNQTFLQFELDQGTKTSLMGGGAREAEDADQAMASVQGASGESKQKDYSQLESLDKKDSNRGHQGESPYGEENKDAVKLVKKKLKHHLFKILNCISNFSRKSNRSNGSLQTRLKKHWSIEKCTPQGFGVWTLY